MPQFSDDLYLGNAETLIAGPDSVGNPGGRGIGPLGRVYIWDSVPLALNASNIAAAQAVAGAGNLVLTAGTGATAGTDPYGNPIIVLDVPRAVQVDSSNAGDTTQTLLVTGYDVYGQRMSELIAFNGTTNVSGQKAFKSILSAFASAALAGNATLGTTDILGIPVRVTDAGYIISVKYNATLAQDAGTFAAADVTNPATTTTNDVRGTYLPSSATDGAKRLVMAISMPAIACGPNATRVGALGVTQA